MSSYRYRKNKSETQFGMKVYGFESHMLLSCVYCIDLWSNIIHHSFGHKIEN